MSKHNGFCNSAETTLRTLAVAIAMIWTGTSARADHAWPPIPMASPHVAPTQIVPTQVAANFTVYLGGVLFIEGGFDARILRDDYHLSTQMKTTGLAGRFYPADYQLTSEGRLAAEHIEPRRFYSYTKAEGDERHLTMTYSKARVPHLSATPPYSRDDLKEVNPALQLNTQDPISVLLVPVSGATDPCERTIPVFDGRRRFNLKLSYQGTKKMTIPDSAEAARPAKSVNAVVCSIRYEAIAPAEKKRRFTKMLRQNNDMKVWLAPFDGARVYMPVRFELGTPFGSAVLLLQNLKEQQVADLNPDKKRSLAVRN